MMPRLHFKQFVTISLSLTGFCVLVLFFLRKPPNDYAHSAFRDIDPEMLKRIMEKPSSPKPTPAKAQPEIHIKKIPNPFEKGLNMNMSIQEVENLFFSYLENKDIRCERDMRLGSMHDGGWNVCMSPPYKLEVPCTVFSFGIGFDWQFDDSVSQIYNCHVLAFDPSVRQRSDRISAMIKFKPIGIGANDTDANAAGWEMKTLGRHLRDEGFYKKTVDYVKIDIEAMEWEVLKVAFQEDSLRYVKQLGFELHTNQFRKTHGKNEAGDKLEFIHMFETLRKIEILGFRKFNYRKNPFGNYHSNYTKKERSCCYELHYINMDFVKDNETIVHTKDEKMFH